MNQRILPDEKVSRVINIILFLLFITISYNLISVYIFKKYGLEDGIVFKIWDGISNFYHSVIMYIQPFKHEFKIASISAIVIIFIGFLTVGMPGAFLLEIPVKLGISKPIKGDNAWPAAIFVSVFFPIFIPMGVILKYELTKNSLLILSNFAITGTIIFGILLSVFLAFFLFYLKKD